MKSGYCLVGNFLHDGINQRDLSLAGEGLQRMMMRRRMSWKRNGQKAVSTHLHIQLCGDDDDDDDNDDDDDD